MEREITIKIDTFKDIIKRYPNQYIEGLWSKDSNNPYNQSFHFELTVEDCKHIAWRKGNEYRIQLESVERKPHEAIQP